MSCHFFWQDVQTVQHNVKVRASGLCLLLEKSKTQSKLKTVTLQHVS